MRICFILSLVISFSLMAQQARAGDWLPPMDHLLEKKGQPQQMQQQRGAAGNRQVIEPLNIPSLNQGNRHIYRGAIPNRYQGTVTRRQVTPHDVISRQRRKSR